MEIRKRKPRIMGVVASFGSLNIFGRNERASESTSTMLLDSIMLENIVNR
ncbi:MAG: hypothetical protein IJ809_07055 [Clostridia bacterium]|nr:hypothetical protein [Clostridia bacterium]